LPATTIDDYHECGNQTEHIVEDTGMKAMMKWALAIALLLTVGAGSGVSAEINFSEFNLLTPTTYEIGTAATSGNGYTLGNLITFYYEDFGDPTANGTAQVGPDG
jgi:hypothetical protein